jgi:hypothetical protein
VQRHKCSGPPREVLHIDADKDDDDARAGPSDSPSKNTRAQKQAIGTG